MTDDDQQAIYLLPSKSVLTDAGTVWESELFRKGFNDLPVEQKAGRLVQAYSDGTWDVRFDALYHTAQGVYPDEVKLVEREEVQ